MTRPLLSTCFHGAIYGRGFFGESETVFEHGGDGTDRAKGIRFILSRDIRAPSRARVRKAGPRARGLLRADGSRGQHADGAGKHRAFIAQDVAEHVLRHDDVEALRIEHKLHGAVIDQQMIERDIRIILRDFDHHAAPELRSFEHVRFIDGRELPAALARELESHAGDAVDLARAYRSSY